MAQRFGSLGLMTSLLLSPDGKTVESEAAFLSKLDENLPKAMAWGGATPLPPWRERACPRP